MSKTYNTIEQLKAIVNAPIPKELIKTRSGGRQTLSYLSGATVINILNEATNYNCNWDIIDQWIEESAPRKEGDKPTRVYICKGVLEVKLADDEGKPYTIRKTGIGSKICLGGNDQENCLKAATTDAIKKAASLLGIGLKLYMNEEEKGIFENFAENTVQWTEKDYEIHSKSWLYIKKLITDGVYDNNELNRLTSEWSGGVFSNFQKISPSSFEDYVEFLKNKQSQVKVGDIFGTVL